MHSDINCAVFPHPERCIFDKYDILSFNFSQRKKKESLVTKPSLLKESLIIPE